jgi:hypothetical protein
VLTIEHDDRPMKRARTLAPALLGVATFLLAAQAGAEPYTHDGYFMRFGMNVGPGLATLSPNSGSVPDIDVTGGQAGIEALFGGSLVDGLVVGGGPFFTHGMEPTFTSTGGDLAYDGSTITFGTMVFIDYYVDPKLGLDLQGFFGYGWLDFLSNTSHPGNAIYHGPMAGLGVGYEFWLADEWSIGPFARFVYGSLAGTDWSARYMYPTLGGTLTFN